MESGRPLCRGVDTDGNQCDCEEFLAPEHPDPKVPLRCAECCHGPSKHPRPSDIAASTGSGSVSSKLRGPAPKDSVLSIFETVTSSAKTATSGMSGLSGSKNKLNIDMAREESLEGYHKKTTKKTKEKLTDDANQRCVGWIALLTTGLKADGTLRSSTLISKASLADLESAGCAKIGGIVFSEKWSYDECTSYFAKIFPQPFNYVLNSQGPAKATRTRAAAVKPAWALVTPDHRKLKLVNKERPTGHDLWFYRGAPRSGLENVHIIIALCKSIPNEVLQSWKPARFIEPQSSDFHTSDVENTSDEQYLMKAADDSEINDLEISDDHQSEISEEVVVLHHTGKRGHDSLDDNIPEDETPSFKKKRLDKAGKAQTTSRRKLDSKMTASRSASGNLTQRTSTPSGHDLDGSHRQASPSVSAGQVICSSCASHKRISPVPRYIEPEEDTSWDDFLGKNKERRHFLNPWDPNYEPLLIFL